MESYKIYRCDTNKDESTCIVLDNINAQEVIKTEDKKSFLFQDIPPKKIQLTSTQFQAFLNQILQKVKNQTLLQQS